MCLSTAYDVGSDGKKFITDKITNVNVENDTVKLTTLLGTQTIIKGQLRSIDLNRNIILIDAKQ